MKYRLKYYSLSKNEKNKLQEDFYKTQHGKDIKVRLNRLFIIGTMSILISILLFLIRNNIWDTFSSVTLLLAGIFFIIASFKVRIKKLNEFLVHKK